MLGKKEIAINEMDISDDEKRNKRDEIRIRLHELIEDEGEIVRDLEDPNICFLQVELSKL